LLKKSCDSNCGSSSSHDVVLPVKSVLRSEPEQDKLGVNVTDHGVGQDDENDQESMEQDHQSDINCGGCSSAKDANVLVEVDTTCDSNCGSSSSHDVVLHVKGVLRSEPEQDKLGVSITDPGVGQDDVNDQECMEQDHQSEINWLTTGGCSSTNVANAFVEVGGLNCL